MRESTLVTASNGERVRVHSGDIIRFQYPVAGHETGIFKSCDGEYCLIQLTLLDDHGEPVVIERYRSEIIV
jgi:hypothetical protein